MAVRNGSLTVSQSMLQENHLHGGLGEQGGVARLKRRMVERVLTRCAGERGADMASLLALLRRFAVEAAREEARMFCDDLVANDIVPNDLVPLPPVNDTDPKLKAPLVQAVFWLLAAPVSTTVSPVSQVPDRMLSMPAFATNTWLAMVPPKATAGATVSRL